MKKLLLVMCLYSGIIFSQTVTKSTGGSRGGGISVTRQTMGDANATYATGTTQVALTSTISVTRIATLPLANTVSAGTELSFVDEIGGITDTKNIQIKRAGANTINGDTMLVFVSPYAIGRFISDGSSKWTSSTGITVSSGTWTPTFTGFSVLPTVDNNEYTYIVYPNGKKECHVSFDSYGGTQSQNIFTMTLPYPANKYTVFICQALDNATGVIGKGVIQPNSNVITFYKDVYGSGLWSATGGKWVAFNLTYFVR